MEHCVSSAVTVFVPEEIHSVGLLDLPLADKVLLSSLSPNQLMLDRPRAFKVMPKLVSSVMIRSKSGKIELHEHVQTWSKQTLPFIESKRLPPELSRAAKRYRLE